MIKYKITISATSYHSLYVSAKNEDEAELKAFHTIALQSLGDSSTHHMKEIDYEMVEINEIEETCLL